MIRRESEAVYEVVKSDEPVNYGSSIDIGIQYDGEFTRGTLEIDDDSDITKIELHEGTFVVFSLAKLKFQGDGEMTSAGYLILEGDEVVGGNVITSLAE